jgi:ribonuclease G
MVDPENRELVWVSLESELRKDRAKNQALRLSDFGLVEITRKRSRENLARILTRPCPECSGSGRILSTATICLNLRREILNRAGSLEDHKLIVHVHPEVASALSSDQHEVRDELKALLGEQLVIEAEPNLAHEHYSIVEV